MTIGEDAHGTAAQRNRIEECTVRVELRELSRRHRVRDDKDIAREVGRHTCGRRKLREGLLARLSYLWMAV